MKSDDDPTLRPGGCKPPKRIKPPIANPIPPIQDHPFPIRNNAQIGNQENLSTPESAPANLLNKKLSGFYIAGCLVLLIAVGTGLKLFRGSAHSNHSSQKSSIQPPGESPPQITNLRDETKGLLPGTNNRYSLSGSNATIKNNNPITSQTAKGTSLDRWQSDQDSVQWEIWIKQRGYYEAIVQYTATTNDNQARIVLKQDQNFPKKYKMRTAEQTETVFEEEFIILFRTTGSHLLEFSTEGDAGDFSLHSIVLRPNRTR
ncbi:MAG: hypothetical protein VX438_13565 [Planctomycetota bacterium]|nr:hypothetical protein [Planctomycetota bacterium]